MALPDLPMLEASRMPSGSFAIAQDQERLKTLSDWGTSSQSAYCLCSDEAAHIQGAARGLTIARNANCVTNQRTADAATRVAAVSCPWKRLRRSLPGTGCNKKQREAQP